MAFKRKPKPFRKSAPKWRGPRFKGADANWSKVAPRWRGGAGL